MARKSHFRQGRRCLHPWNTLKIYPDGGMGLCLRDMGLSANIGRLPGDRPTAAWNGERAKAFRRQLVAEGSFAVCARCLGYHKG